jgi:hypothetical protein
MFVVPDQAAAIVGERLGVAPTRPGAEGVAITPRARRAAATVFPLPSRGRGALHFPFSEFLDWNDPPLFKSFLRIDATPERVSMRCFAATGCRAHENDRRSRTPSTPSASPTGAGSGAMTHSEHATSAHHRVARRRSRDRRAGRRTAPP